MKSDVDYDAHKQQRWVVKEIIDQNTLPVTYKKPGFRFH